MASLFLFYKEQFMSIEEIIKEKQPDVYKKLKPKKKVEKLTEQDIKELMGQRVYKRGKGGSIKQVR